MSPNTVASGVANPIWNNVTPDTLLIAYETGILTRKVLKIPCTATVASAAPATPIFSAPTSAKSPAILTTHATPMRANGVLASPVRGTFHRLR